MKILDTVRCLVRWTSTVRASFVSLPSAVSPSPCTARSGVGTVCSVCTQCSAQYHPKKRPRLSGNANNLQQGCTSAVRHRLQVANAVALDSRKHFNFATKAQERWIGNAFPLQRNAFCSKSNLQLHPPLDTFRVGFHVWSKTYDEICNEASLFSNVPSFKTGTFHFLFLSSCKPPKLSKTSLWDIGCYSNSYLKGSKRNWRGDT